MKNLIIEFDDDVNIKLLDATTMREIATKSRIRYSKEQIDFIISSIQNKTLEGELHFTHVFRKSFDDATISKFVIELRNKGYKVDYDHVKEKISIEWY